MNPLPDIVKIGWLVLQPEEAKEKLLAPREKQMNDLPTLYEGRWLLEGL